MITAYTLAFGSLLLLGCRLGDILGRRSVFMVGVGLFTAASLVGGLAPNGPVLLIARAVQGGGAAIGAALPEAFSGLGSGLLNASTSMAIAGLTTLSVSTFHNHLHGHLADPAVVHQALTAGFTSGLKASALIIAVNLLPPSSFHDGDQTPPATPSHLPQRPTPTSRPPATLPTSSANSQAPGSFCHRCAPICDDHDP